MNQQETEGQNPQPEAQVQAVQPAQPQKISAALGGTGKCLYCGTSFDKRLKGQGRAQRFCKPVCKIKAHLKMKKAGKVTVAPIVAPTEEAI